MTARRTSTTCSSPRKIDHAFFLGPGRHDFAFWSARVPKSLAFLRDHTTAAK